MSIPVEISVIVPVYNGGQDFKNCLQKLIKADPPALEIIVVADGDTDGSGDYAQSLGLKVVTNQTAQGPAIARNQGAKIAQGTHLFFVDADVLIYPDTIGKVIQAFQKNSQIGALFGSYDDAPGATNFLSQYKNLVHHYVHQTGSAEASTFWSGCGAIKKDLFLQFGGFKESYKKPAIEDIELGYRLRREGHKIRLEKSIQVKHLKRWTPLSLLLTDFFQRALPWMELITREGKAINDLNLNYTSRISTASVFLLLFCLVMIWLHPLLFLSLAMVFLMVALYLNRELYVFFLQKRGVLFTVLAIVWHLFYYFYCGVAFIWGLVRSWIQTTDPA